MSEIADAIEAAVAGKLGEINTIMPGRVVSYDATRNRAVVQPVLPKMLADGSTLAPPAIHEVPILWPTGGGAVITLPLQAGDEVWLEFSQRSLEGWLAGNDAAPDDPRQFDLTDCVARPGGGRDVAGVDTEAVVVGHGASALRMLPDGTSYLTGTLFVSGDVVAGTVSLKTHVHTGVTAGAAISGPPQP